MFLLLIVLTLTFMHFDSYAVIHTFIRSYIHSFTHAFAHSHSHTSAHFRIHSFTLSHTHTTVVHSAQESNNFGEEDEELGEEEKDNEEDDEEEDTGELSLADQQKYIDANSAETEKLLVRLLCCVIPGMCTE